MSSFNLVHDLYLALKFALWPTIRHISTTPSVLFHPAAISRIFFSHVWTAFGAGIDENGAQLRTSLITPNAYGVVLDIGAGEPFVRSLDHSPCSSHFKGTATR